MAINGHGGPAGLDCIQGRGLNGEETEGVMGGVKHLNGRDSRMGAAGNAGRRSAARLCCGAGKGAGGRGRH
jgi:hypothetical protein